MGFSFSSAVAFAALWLVSNAAVSQAYPSRPVTMLFPYPPGGFDVMARAFTEPLGRALGQQVVLVNRDGAAGRIAFEQLAVAKPDGYTIAFSPAAPLTSVPHLQQGVPYRYDSFSYVCQVFENTFTISVPANSRFQTLAQLVEFAKANPGKVNFGHAGVGSGPHLADEGFAEQLGLKLQAVPYRGGNPMLAALAAGQIDFSSPGVASIAPRRDIRVLALFSDKRSAFLPDVPTVKELGLPPLQSDPQGIFTPKGVPPEVLSALENACKAASESTAFRSFSERLYQSVEFLPGNDLFRRHAADSTAKESLIRRLNLRAD